MPDISQYLVNISVITYLVVFAAGVATSFTPCIYPLIPITISVIGSARQQSKLKNFILALSYALGLSLTFSILGLIAALTGSLFGELQSSPLAHLIVGGVIILFALSLLDIINLPTFLLHRAGAGKIVKGGKILPVFLMGAVSGFVAAPCTVAVLAALLTYVAARQNVLFGSTLLFTFAIGLSTLLIIVGTFSGILANISGLQKRTKFIQKILALAMIALGCYFIYTAGILSV